MFNVKDPWTFKGGQTILGDVNFLNAVWNSSAPTWWSGFVLSAGHPSHDSST
jgi:hypothetical protein